MIRALAYVAALVAFAWCFLYAVTGIGAPALAGLVGAVTIGTAIVAHALWREGELR